MVRELLIVLLMGTVPAGVMCASVPELPKEPLQVRAENTVARDLGNNRSTLRRVLREDGWFKSPGCEEDEVLAGTGNYENGVWEGYRCTHPDTL